MGAKGTNFSGKKLLKNVDPNLFISENGVCQLSPFPKPPPPFLGALLTPPPPEVKTRHAKRITISTLSCILHPPWSFESLEKDNCQIDFYNKTAETAPTQ